MFSFPKSLSWRKKRLIKHFHLINTQAICLPLFAMLSLFLLSGCGTAEAAKPKIAQTIPVSESAKETSVEEETEEIAQTDPLEEAKERILTSSLTMHFGQKEERLEKDVFESWILQEGNALTLDQEKVKEYVRSLAIKYDTIGTNRSFKTTGGETITVKGGNYGFWMDRQSTIDALTEAILAGTIGEFEPVYYCKGANYGENEIGDSYVEINLDAQHVYVYKNGSLVTQADCVSGKVSNGNYTPGGTYQITYKERDATLRGQGYNSKVKYWMPFNNNIGMHDASWRSSFGGEIYLRSGSHGCVNLPPSITPTIFENVEKGEAVVVYGGKTSVPKEEKPITKQYLMEQLLSEMSAEQVGLLSLDEFHRMLREILTQELARRGTTMTEAQIQAIITEGETPVPTETTEIPAEQPTDTPADQAEQPAQGVPEQTDIQPVPTEGVETPVQ